jgi:hypothetical protein
MAGQAGVYVGSILMSANDANGTKPTLDVAVTTLSGVIQASAW